MSPTEAALLRFAKLLFQLSDQFFKAFFGERIVGSGSHSSGLSEPPL